MKKAGKIILKIAASLLCVILLAALSVFVYYKAHTPTVIFDASQLTGEVTSGASGYLYGLSEDGIPSYNMAESLDISSVSAKTPGGLQHPVGDADNVSNELTSFESLDYIVVYLQDMYSTWYYDHENITEMKKNGTYDWKEYIQSEFFPLIEKTVKTINEADYRKKIVFCPYNECDNAIWFGTWNKEGEYHVYEGEGQENFYEAWKITYDYLRSLSPDVLIGGPGNFEYNTDKTESFLKYTTENDCVPDVIIYHELNSRSIYDFKVHVNELRSLEEKYGISADTPIIVTEYGEMADNGNPNTMLKYIARIENSKVYGNQAFWLLANNLCNTCADYNTPNSAWWVYRWYANMNGETMSVKVSDFFHSDVEKAIKQKRELRNQNLLGVGTINENKIDILVSGTDYKSAVKIKNLKNASLYSKTVKVTVTAMTYQGISGKVYAPEVVETYTDVCSDTLTVKLQNPNSNTAYHIEVTEADEKEEKFTNSNLYTRYEFENGTLLGKAYTYDSAYATTGEQNGMVGGIENYGDGVKIEIDIPEDGYYELRYIFGNSNDGQTAQDRTYTTAGYVVDSQDCGILTFENTIKSELTTCFDLNSYFEKGTHTIELNHGEGTFVLDSLLVRKAQDTSVYTEKDDTGENSYLAISPSDGYYTLKTDANTVLSADGATAETNENGTATVYLRRGLNYIDLSKETENGFCITPTDKKVESLVFEAKDASLSGSAKVLTNNTAQKDYISGITSNGGSAKYSLDVPKSGTYKLTILYSFNGENGVHDYNVDLIEAQLTISVNGKKQQNLYCRNTYSNDTFITVTANIDLEKGKNTITFSSDGERAFNGGITYAPNISLVTVNSVSA